MVTSSPGDQSNLFSLVSCAMAFCLYMDSCFSHEDTFECKFQLSGVPLVLMHLFTVRCVKQM